MNGALYDCRFQFNIQLLLILTLEVSIMNNRDAILEAINPLIADFIVKAKNGRIRDEQKAKIRISYANALSNLIRAYSTLLRDKEYEELLEKVERLENEFKKDKE